MRRMNSGNHTTGGYSTPVLSCSPSGHLHFDGSPSVDGPADLVVARRLAAAFERSVGAGLLFLATREGATSLPPDVAFAREVARLYLTRLCALPGLDEAVRAPEVPAPRERLLELVLAAPPMTGGEYLTADVLVTVWGELPGAVEAELRGQTVAAWLKKSGGAFSEVGRVTFHLAESKATPETPFAFLATYTTKLSETGRVQHVPIGRALKDSATASDRNALLALLEPVRKAAMKSPFAKELLDSGSLFRPLPFTPADAHRLLKEVPLLEESGVVVRVPDWWSPKRPRRPEVIVTIGTRGASSLGFEALLDFQVSMALDGEKLTKAEWKALTTGAGGLVSLRGKWVDVDPERLADALARWKKAESAAAGGVSFHDAMRLMAGAPVEAGAVAGALERDAGFSRVVPGPWLAAAMDELRRPAEAFADELRRSLRTTLRPYQARGVAWLFSVSRLGLGGCLADDMGLGKTVQVIALYLLLKKRSPEGLHLLVLPASLLLNWQSELLRFAPSLRVGVAHPSAGPFPGVGEVDVVLTTYGSVARYEAVTSTAWETIVVDEAQAIKNPSAKQTRAVKALKGSTRLALTGTPVENRLSDLWSIYDFTCPGLLGTAPAFSRFAKGLASDAAHGYAPLRELVRPYLLRRLKTDRTIIADLPDKTELKVYTGLSRTQAALYQTSVDELTERLAASTGIERRGLVLAFLVRLKQICNHPSQWTGDGLYRVDDSGKLKRLAELAEEIAARQEKALVFTQFEQLTEPLATFLAKVFGRPGLVLTGKTPVAKRRALVEDFQREDGPPFFVLSLKAGGTGLTLTAASHVVHFDRWWNPAVENQATDRAFRIGQKRNVLVHKLITKGTLEERIDALIEGKRKLSGELLDGAGEMSLTELTNEELLRVVSLDLTSAMTET